MRSTLVPAILSSLLFAACVDGSTHPVAVFQVLDETFRIELATPELVDEARAHLGEQIIPIGTVVRGDPGVN